MSYCFNPRCQQPENPAQIDTCQSCGNSLLLQERYRALKILGQGGFGKTFLVVDEKEALKPPYALKQLIPLFSEGEIKKTQVLFQQEVQRLENLGVHSQIPSLIDHFQADGNLYLLQEYIEGYNLATELAETGPFSERQIWQLLQSLLPLLQYVHQHHVIHRDLKPENIIRRQSDEKLVLVDFGAAKLLTGTALVATGTKIGSPIYASPEQLLGKALPASDLYSLGVTCLHLLTQVSPFELFDISENNWAWHNYLPSPVSPELTQILDRLVEQPTKKRYKTVSEVWQDVQPHLTPTPHQADSPSSQPSKPPKPPQPVKIGDKWGYQNSQGQVVTNLLFDEAGKFKGGLAQVKVAEKYGCINSYGQLVIPLKFTSIGPFNKQGLAQVKLVDKYGYINKRGEEVIAPRFHWIGSFNKDSLAPVQLGGKYGYIDSRGKEVIPPQFEQLGNFSQGLAAVCISSRWGYIDTQGRVVIMPQFAAARAFAEGLAAVKSGQSWGYIDTKGKFLIPPQFPASKNFSHGLAAVQLAQQWGYINTRGEIAIPCQFESGATFRQGIAQVKQGGESYYLNPQGRKFTSVSRLRGGLRAVKSSPGWGYLNQQGEIVIPCQFVQAGAFSQGLAAVQPTPNFLTFWQRGLWGYIDKAGTMVIKPQYKEAGNFKHGVALVQLKGKFTYIKQRGEVVSPRFETVGEFKQGLALVQLGKKFGYINPQGRVVIPFQFLAARDFQEDFAAVKLRLKFLGHLPTVARWGYINRAGQLIINPRFQEAANFKQGKARVVYAGREHYIDLQGNFLSA